VSATFARLCRTREQLHEAVMTLYEIGKTVVADGEQMLVSGGQHQEPITVKQRGFLHVAVLPQIAEQVKLPDGSKFVAGIWKEHLKELFIPDKWDMTRIPFVRDRGTGEWKPSKRKVPVKRHKSTEDLNIKEYSEFIDNCINHAAAEWGVVFRFRAEEREAVRYTPPKKKPRIAQSDTPIPQELHHGEEA